MQDKDVYAVDNFIIARLNVFLYVWIEFIYQIIELSIMIIIHWQATPIKHCYSPIQFWFGLWCLTPFSTIFQYIMAVSFICGGNRSTQNKPPTCRKSLTNFIIMLYWIHLGMNRSYRVWTHNFSGDRQWLHRQL